MRRFIPLLLALTLIGDVVAAVNMGSAQPDRPRVSPAAAVATSTARDEAADLAALRAGRVLVPVRGPRASRSRTAHPAVAHRRQPHRSALVGGSSRAAQRRAVEPAPAGAAAWAAMARTVRLRNCESGNNYRSVNKSGKYRGAYQMDREFWLDHGGNPAITPDQASKAEQDAVAYRGWLQRGWSPWPVCGYV